jgi:two-component system, NtrC family, response regulator HydG
MSHPAVFEPPSRTSTVVERGNVLIVDDEAVVTDSLSRWLAEDGYQVATASSAAEALRRFAERPWDLVMIDIKMPGMDGLELQRRLHDIDPSVLLVIMTGYASVDTAVSAMKHGAYDYITKPFDPDDVSKMVARAVEHRRLSRDNARLREQLEMAQPLAEMIGDSPQMKRLQEQILTVGPTDTTVLILGESGTGKELVARALHASSPRRYSPMVIIHCGALADTLLETELFGHEKGAFTGAQYRKKGKFEIAEGGTVFLDEIGDITLKTQTDLLRVLQEKEITRVGGNQPLSVDFRAVAATHRTLDEMVKDGRFRADLFYRLNVFPITVPPLRERREDIPLLAHHFMKKYSTATHKRFTELTREALDLLLRYHWPGNVRELENAVERAVVIGHEPGLRADDFPFQSPQGAPGTVPRSLEELEKIHIGRILEECNWNMSRAARILQVDRGTLYHKIRRYGYTRPHGHEEEETTKAAHNGG